MNTADILLRSAQTATNFEQAQRIDILLTLADVFGKVTKDERNTIALTIANNEDVNNSYLNAIEEEEENYLQRLGRIY